MASIRKRYADRVEASPRHDGPSVTTPPTGAAKLPDPVVDAKPPELPPTESPVDKAAKDAIALQLRLKEMERAEQLNREAVQQPPPHAAEPQQQPAMPAHIEKWLAEHPQYMDRNDVIAQTEISLATMKATRDGLTWNDDDFLPSIERYLGIAPRGNGHAEQRPVERPAPAPAAPPRYAAPPRQQRSTAPVSAPPSRDVPSFSTGRPQGGPVRLTPAQQEAARFSGISEQEYARQLVKMERMKASGEIDDNGRR